jgi:hypothetical protein
MPHRLVTLLLNLKLLGNMSDCFSKGLQCRMERYETRGAEEGIG